MGDLSDVLESHWSSTVNDKTRLLWSHRQLTDQIELTIGDIGTAVEEVSEQDFGSNCPKCSSENVSWTVDEFDCQDRRSEAHSDVAGAWNLLQDHQDSVNDSTCFRTCWTP